MLASMNHILGGIPGFTRTWCLTLQELVTALCREQLPLEYKEATNKILQVCIQISLVDSAMAVTEGQYPSSSRVSHLPLLRTQLTSTHLHGRTSRDFTGKWFISLMLQIPPSLLGL